MIKPVMANPKPKTPMMSKKNSPPTIRAASEPQMVTDRFVVSTVPPTNTLQISGTTEASASLDGVRDGLPQGLTSLILPKTRRDPKTDEPVSSAHRPLSPFGIEACPKNINVAVRAIRLRVVFPRGRFGRPHKTRLERPTQRTAGPVSVLPAERQRMLPRTSSKLSRRACAISDCYRERVRSRRRVPRP